MMIDNFFSIIAVFASSFTGAVNFIEVRRIGNSVHSSIRTMYLGIVGLLFSIITVVVIEPNYFKLWQPSNLYKSWD